MSDCALLALPQSDSLNGEQAGEAGTPIYRKGSGLAQLARYLQNAQRLRTAPAKLATAADLSAEDAVAQRADGTAGPSPTSVAKYAAFPYFILPLWLLKHRPVLAIAAGTRSHSCTRF